MWFIISTNIFQLKVTVVVLKIKSEETFLNTTPLRAARRYP
jgi:hypothetical protein